MPSKEALALMHKARSFSVLATQKKLDGKASRDLAELSAEVSRSLVHGGSTADRPALLYSSCKTRTARSSTVP